MTTTRAPAGQSAGGGTDSAHGNRAPGIAGVSGRFTARGYVLVVAALLVSGLSLSVAAPGGPPAAYLAAAAALLFLISMVLHEIAHAVAARRHGIRVSQIIVGFLGGITHGRFELPGAGPDGGRIVRALTWARPGDLARASPLGALRTNRGTAAGR